MTDLFGRLVSPRKRAMSERQLHILNQLLEEDAFTFAELSSRVHHHYTVKNPTKALIRDLGYLVTLQAITVGRHPDRSAPLLSINLEWPAQITETEFSQRLREPPKAKLGGFLSP